MNPAAAAALFLLATTQSMIASSSFLSNIGNSQNALLPPLLAKVILIGIASAHISPFLPLGFSEVRTKPFFKVSVTEVEVGFLPHFPDDVNSFVEFDFRHDRGHRILVPSVNERILASPTFSIKDLQRG